MFFSSCAGLLERNRTSTNLGANTMTSSVTLDLVFAILAVAGLVLLTRLAHLVAGGTFESRYAPVELEPPQERELAAEFRRVAPRGALASPARHGRARAAGCSPKARLA
jgi:hypothetical protein